MGNLSPIFLNFKMGFSQFAKWAKISQSLLSLFSCSSFPLLLSLFNNWPPPFEGLPATWPQHAPKCHGGELVNGQCMMSHFDPLPHAPIFSRQSLVNHEFSPSSSHFHQPNLLSNNSIFFISFLTVPLLPGETHQIFGTLTCTPTFGPNNGYLWNEMIIFLLYVLLSFIWDIYYLYLVKVTELSSIPLARFMRRHQGGLELEIAN